MSAKILGEGLVVTHSNPPNILGTSKTFEWMVYFRLANFGISAASFGVALQNGMPHQLVEGFQLSPLGISRRLGAANQG